MRTFAAAVLAILMVAGTSSIARQDDPNLSTLLEQYQAAWNKGDAKALASLYVQDAVRMQPEGAAVVGRPAIEQLFVKNFNGPWKGTKLTLKAGKTQEISRDVRIQDGTWEVSGGPDGVQRGRYLNTVVRDGATWKLASVAPVPDTPPAK